MATLQNFGVPESTTGGRGGILQPKVKWKFRVIVANFGIAASAIQLTQQVQTVDRPSYSSESQTVHSYNSQAYYSGKSSWGTIALKVRDDVTNSVSALIGAQIQKQMDFFQQTTPLAGGNYKFLMEIDTLDGGNDAPLESWVLEGCFLTEVKYDGFDYGSSEHLTIDLTVRADNITQTGGLMPTPAIPSPSSYGGLSF